MPETDLEDKSIASEKGTVKGDKVASASVAEEKGSVEEDIKPQLGSKRTYIFRLRFDVQKVEGLQD